MKGVGFDMDKKCGLGAKNKSIILLLLIGTLLYTFTGCGNTETISYDAENQSVETQRVPADDFQGISLDSSETSDIQDNVQVEFDFQEAIKRIDVFGYKMSLPCAVEDLGEPFSLDEETEWVTFGNVVTSDLYYEGEKIGSVNLLSDDKEQILCFNFGFISGYNDIEDEDMRKAVYDSYGWYSEEIQIDFYGLNFKSSADDIKKHLGNPTEKTDEYFQDYLVYEYSDGYIWIEFAGDAINQFIIGLL